ncbi:FAD-binding oxidoreductase [Nocardioides bigeumensis]|uniref:FAD-binding oxidoreductase n=1 Tax=Nocardioides bigeumensis TaxID=433657 RepID=A0ABP5KMB0_9ACTN
MSTQTPRPAEADVLNPGDDGYDGARRVWNAMVDRRPRRIVRCRSAADVAAAVVAARAEGLEIGIRCGGHSVVGHAVPDDGVMLDLRPLGAVRVDPDSRRAWLQGGALLGALDAATQAHGLATTAGNVSHTGAGGLILGGGMGWLARQHGLSCDNVVSFEVVTADGQVLRASADEHPDLYWALRGGGGNFGVVTEFELRLHDTGTRAVTAEVDLPATDARDAMRTWRDLAMDAPRAATHLAVVAGGIATLGLVWVGDPEAARPHVDALTALGPVVAERVAETTYVALQTREDDIEAHDIRRYWKGHYFAALTDDAVDAFLSHDPAAAASLQRYGGAIADVPVDSTAFSRRDTAFEYVGAARWTDPDEDSTRIAVARANASLVEPFASGIYVNTLGDDGIAGLQRAYPPETLARLRAVKAAYDPQNVFHLNQNIPPAS